MASNMTAQDLKWQAQDDARSLIRAEVIKMDPKRLKAAKVQANVMRKEKEAEAAALKKIANKST